MAATTGSEDENAREPTEVGNKRVGGTWLARGAAGRKRSKKKTGHKVQCWQPQTSKSSLVRGAETTTRCCAGWQWSLHCAALHCRCALRANGRFHPAVPPFRSRTRHCRKQSDSGRESTRLDSHCAALSIAHIGMLIYCVFVCARASIVCGTARPPCRLPERTGRSASELARQVPQTKSVE